MYSLDRNVTHLEDLRVTVQLLHGTLTVKAEATVDLHGLVSVRNSRTEELVLQGWTYREAVHLAILA